jgi:hypothetical protein
MKQIRVVMLTLLMVLLCGLFSQAQQSVATATDATVPPLIQFSNVATDEGGNTLSEVVSITFSLYSSQQGGEPLWTETQNNVQLDPTGHYSVQLGITKPNGVPTALFTTGEARWLGVRIAEQGEQPRVLLLSVPYALKAGDAATVGGLPPSAFVLAAPQNGTSTYIPEPAAEPSVTSDTVSDVTTTGGTLNFLPLFSGAATIVDSVVFQSAASPFKIGIGTTTPATTLDVKGAATIRGTLSLPAPAAATATKGTDSQPLILSASAFNSTSSTALNQVFQWQAEPAGNDTTAPSGTLNLLFGEGTTTPSETGLKLSSKGIFTFATGQTFPGTGDGSVTSVATGLGLTGGPITKTGTLAIDTTKIPQLAVANTFTADQKVDAILTAASTSLGVHGTSDGASTMGVGFSKAGVWGDTGGAAGDGYAGVLGTADGNTAGWFLNNGAFAAVVATNAGSGNGVTASTATTTGYGVEGSSPNIGVYGASAGASAIAVSEGLNTLTGIWGDTGGAANGGYVGVTGTADENNAALFENNSSSNAAVLMGNFAESSSSAIVLEAFGGTFPGVCTINVSGNITCNGTVVTVVPADSGTRKVALYSMQSPENWFEDAGSGQLSNGSARIELDPTFAQTVNAGVEYHVFLTPNGDCKGLYVTQKAASSFEVNELGGGRSNIAFDYRIMAKRVGYENVRLADLTEQLKKQEAQRRKVQRPVRPSAAPRPGAGTPGPQLKTAAQTIAAQPK